MGDVKQDVEKGLAFDEVKLSDGRIVKLREGKGSDDFVIAAELGPVLAGNAGSAIILINAGIAKTIVSIDGKPVEPLRDFEKYRDLLDSFKSKDWSKISKKYNELNGDDEKN